MNLDIKNNKYLLSLIASILGTVVFVIIEYISSKEENNKVDYLQSLKIMAIIFCCVVGSLSLISSTPDINTPNMKASNIMDTNTSMGDLNLNSGLQEVNMNQSIHTGNPQF